MGDDLTGFIKVAGRLEARAGRLATAGLSAQLFTFTKTADGAGGTGIDYMGDLFDDRKLVLDGTEVSMHRNQTGRSHRFRFAQILALLLVLVALAALAQANPFAFFSNGRVEKEVRSDYSHIRIRNDGNVRTMNFVRDSGQEVVETFLDLKQPHKLIAEYTRYMFLSYVVRPRQERVLIVGLGGGAMLHFLARYDPQLKVDVVEIDPTVVQLARDYFGVKSEGNVNIITADAFKYLAETQVQYDVIYMDAFLKPSADTDSTGVPLRLKQVQFYKELHRILKPEGVVAFNINPSPSVRDDVAAITAGFPQAYAWRLPDTSGVVVVASLTQQREPLPVLARKARDLDARFRADFSFAKMTGGLSR